MNDTNAFLQLFSDQAATPSEQFVSSLKKQYMIKAGGSSVRWTPKNKLLLGVATLVGVGVILGLVFLPRRDMSDPTKDSLIEAVVVESQDGASSFVETTGPEAQSQDSTAQSTTNKPTAQTNSSIGANSQNQSSSSQTSTPAPIVISGFSAEFWNLVAESAGPPSMPIGAADYSTTTSSISYNWGAGHPVGITNVDNFVARFTKTSSDIKGQYKVTYSSDNGIRMFVDEMVVFDKWNETSSSGIAYFTTDATAPTNTITIEYYEATGNANISVEITKL